MKIGLLYSRVRFEEKLIIEALQSRGLNHDLIDDREISMAVSGVGQKDNGTSPLTPGNFSYDVVLDRAMEFTRGLYALRVLNDWGVKTVNHSSVVGLCGDKLLTTSALTRANVPQPRTVVAFTPEAALTAIEEMGYPVVIKPIIGSWGRLVSRINDRDAAEAILEHKSILGTYLHEIFYIQEFINKPGRDIRVIVVGDETICAIYRESEHWITNTARGATATVCPVTSELDLLAQSAAKAVGGGVLAIDVIEDPNRGYLVNEINPTPEFRGALTATQVDIPNKMIDYVIEVGKKI